MGKKTGKTRKKAAGGKSAKRSSGRILYFDGPAPEDGAVEAWIEAHCGSGIESMAGAAWEDLASPARREGALAALWGLADEGSALAACALGCLVRQGLPAPEGTDAKALLEKAAEAGIGPAYLELAQMELARTDGRPDGTRREEAAPEEGQPEKAPAEGARAEDSAASSCAGAAADLVLKGFELGSPGCALLLAEQRLAGQILLSEETAEELGTALLACAGAGSWPSLKALADLLAETSPCANYAELARETLRLVSEAARAGRAKACALLGAVFLHGTLAERDEELARSWLGRAWKAGETAAGIDLAEALHATMKTPAELARAYAVLETCRERGMAEAHGAAGCLLMDMRADSGAGSTAAELLEQGICAGATKAAVPGAWAICLKNWETGGEKLETGLRLLRLAAERHDGQARVHLAHLRLSGMDGRPAGTAEGTALLDAALADHVPQAYGLAACLHLLGLHGTKPDAEKGFALALEGWRRGDIRSQTLLGLNRAGLLGGAVREGLPRAIHEEEDAVQLLVRLARRGDLMALEGVAALETARRSGNEDFVGATLARIWLGSLKERDWGALVFFPDTLLALGPGAPEAADAIALACAKVFHFDEVKNRVDLIDVIRTALARVRRMAETAGGACEPAGAEEKA